jgi:phosphatidylglycerol:prolipoprotein diacylglycerol transferase
VYPLLLQIGPVGIRAFPVVLTGALLAGNQLAAREFRRRGLDPDLASDFLTPAIILGLVGARLFHVLVFDPAWYLAHPSDLLALWTGGLAYPGALVAGLGAALWFCWRRGLGFWRFADGVVPALALGQAIGAVGTLLNGSSYGTPTTLPWAIVFADPRSQAPLGVPLHPTQLYESLAAMLLFGALWWARTRVHRDGALFLLYLLGAAALAGLDALKGDALWFADVVVAGPVTTLVVLAGATAVWLRHQPDRLDAVEVLASWPPASVDPAEATDPEVRRRGRTR